MNYFEQQARARWVKYYYLLLFACAIILTAALLSSFFTLVLVNDKFPVFSVSGLIVFCSVGAVVAISFLLIAVYNIIKQRKGGGSGIATALGAKPLPDESADANERRLRNIVEEISIAAGLPVPCIFVLDDEETINAFVAGYTPNDAAIAVTRGAMTRLNRAELQGVVCHEFSHILNGDMRLNTNMVGWLSAVTAVYDWGAGENGVAPYILKAIGSIGMCFGGLIKAAANRRREYFADASAVRLSRQESGIVGALKKIACLDSKAVVHNAAMSKVSHMMFSEAMLGMHLMATHPPVIDRIKRLDPRFDPAELNDLRKRWLDKLPDGLEEDERNSIVSPVMDIHSMSKKIVASPLGVIMQLNTTSNEKYKISQSILAGIPDLLKQAARNQHGAIPLVFALLLAGDKEVLSKQLEILRADYQNEIILATQAFSSQVNLLDTKCCLPLAELCFPALRQRSRDEVTKLLGSIHALINADEKVSLFEYCLSHMLDRQLRDSLAPAQAGEPGSATLKDIAASVDTLMTVLVQTCQCQSGVAEAAYVAGMSHALPDVIPEYQSKQLLAKALDPVWAKLDTLSSSARQKLIESLVIAIKHDDEMTDGEVEILRTVCAYLHCPLPVMGDLQTVETA